MKARVHFCLLGALAVIASHPQLSFAERDDAEVDDIDIDKKMQGEKDYKVKVTIANDGDVTWEPGKGYSMIFENIESPSGSKAQRDEFRCDLPLDSKTGPNQDAKFEGEVTAPTWAGKWKMQASMAFKGKKFGDVKTVEVEVLKEFDAKVLDVDVPSKIEAGKDFKVEVEVQNTSDIIWPETDFVIKSIIKRGEDTGSSTRDCLQRDVEPDKNLEPGDRDDYTVELEGPEKPGKYTIEWTFYDTKLRKKFGDTKEIEIEVVGSD
ncbi:MAG: hypothetical protein ACI8UO_004160 [Verrucomicrobiales bacterium]|jgi:hypothetical protein